MSNNVHVSFSKNAKTYDDYNIVQNWVVKELIGQIVDQPASILDIGCGSGAVYKNIDWQCDHFVAIDFAQTMLDIHPQDDKTILLLKDFNDPDCFDRFQSGEFDRIISASALQWANDLDDLLGKIKRLHAPVSLAIFTSRTFRTLHQTATISSPLRSLDEVQTLAQNYFSANYTQLNYQLHFSSVRDMFRYIKRSGVNGGTERLSYKQMRYLMDHYPLDYLEFEILLIHEE